MRAGVGSRRTQAVPTRGVVGAGALRVRGGGGRAVARRREETRVQVQQGAHCSAVRPANPSRPGSPSNVIVNTGQHQNRSSMNTHANDPINQPGRKNTQALRQRQGRMAVGTTCSHSVVAVVAVRRCGRVVAPPRPAQPSSQHGAELPSASQACVTKLRAGLVECGRWLTGCR